MEGQKKHKLGTVAIIVLVVFATIADLLSLIPFVGDLVGPIFWVCVSIYFWKAGMGLINVRKLATSIISMVAELIPAVQELPLILAGIIAVIVMTRAEEKLLGKQGPSPEEIEQNQQRQTLYTDGQRVPTENVGVEDGDTGEAQNVPNQTKANNRPIYNDGVRGPSIPNTPPARAPIVANVAGVVKPK
jgi:hypothetical protein